MEKKNAIFFIKDCSFIQAFSCSCASSQNYKLITAMKGFCVILLMAMVTLAISSEIDDQWASYKVN